MEKNASGETSPPLTVGTRLRVTIQDLAFGGEGVARVNDFVLFIPFVIPGEEVEVDVTEVKKNFGRAKLVSVVTPSPDRVQPRCQYFGVCGGCQYQHLLYERQLHYKHKQIVELFKRVGGIPSEAIQPVVPCPQPYGYRNRIMIRSQWDKFKQGLNIGYVQAENRLVVDIEECHIAEPVLTEQIQSVRRNPPPKGGLKVVLRVLPDDWEVPKDSFFQNNFHLLPSLVDEVRSAIASSKVRYLIDSYCGVGFFGISVADLVERFVGVEYDPQAIKAARRNAQNRNIGNGEFFHGRTEELLAELLSRFDSSQTALVLDPPRAGCAPEALEMIRQARLAQVIYVSCHPATLARDLNILTSGGVFDIAKVVPLDMFPQTQHVECIADLRLREESSGFFFPSSTHVP